MRRFVRAATMLSICGLGVTAPALSQTVPPELERRIRNLIYLGIKARFLASRNMRTEGLGADELEAMIRRGNHPYTRQWAFKAFAACLRWPTRPGEKIRIVGVYSVYQSMNAGGEALAECKARYETRNCECALVDENDRNMLRVPKRVILLLIRRSRGRTDGSMRRPEPARRRGGRMTQWRGRPSRR